MGLFEIVALADSGAAPAGDAAGGAGGILAIGQLIIPFAIIFVLMYFMMIRPQRKQQKETQAMRDALKVGDKVTTIGGIVGKVVKIKDNYIWIETGTGVSGDDNVKSTIKFERSAINSVEQKQAN